MECTVHGELLYTLVHVIGHVVRGSQRGGARLLVAWTFIDVSYIVLTAESDFGTSPTRNIGHC